MNRTLTGVFWIGIYLAVVLLPVFLMLVPPVPSGRSFWLEFSLALGFAGLTQIAVQFVLIARFRQVTAPYGIDVILQYHRQIALVAVAAILAHPIIIVIDNPSRVTLLNPFGGNWASRAGWASVLAMLGIVISSLYRKRLRLPYEVWRLLHLGLGVAAVVFAQLHASLAGLYKNTLWKQAIWVVIALAMVGLVVVLRVVKPLWQRSYPWRVVEVTRQPGDTYGLVLEAVGHDGFRFEPGQFAWIKLAHSPFTLEEHPFSFVSSAERTDRLEFGVKVLGDFTRRVADTPLGTWAYLDGPHGAFSIDRYPAAGFVFVAGGVGITPLMSFLNTMADRKDLRPVTLVYANGSLDGIAYSDDLRGLASRLNLEVVHVIEKPPDDWVGESGFIDEAMLRRVLPQDSFPRTIFLCGPAPMMEATRTALHALGIPPERIQSESFNLV